MPELPEVEITTQNLQQIIKPPRRVAKFIFFRKDLRNKFPIRKIMQLQGMEIKKIYRRAKFIIFEFDRGNLLSHLGMTGSWRLEKSETLEWRRKHDHIAIVLADDVKKNISDQVLVYSDARRFGEFDFKSDEELQKRFKAFGAEPLADKTDWLTVTQNFKKLTCQIKVALMNQKNLVGVGNIYACEALFRASVRPQRACNKVTLNEYNALWSEVQKVLREAIAVGGLSIQDFRNGYGGKGEFQK